MSNTFCSVIFGCPVPSGGYAGWSRSVEQVVLLQETCRDESCNANQVGWHQTYDQNGDLLWFGVSGGTASNGFGPIPEVSEGLKAAVLAAWNELPEDTRGLLGPPKVQMMVGID